MVKIDIYDAIKDIEFPNLISVDAVNETEETFPIEIYAVSEKSSIGCLVNFLEINRWEHISKDYVFEHFISDRNIIDVGTFPEEICEKLNNLFSGKVVYSNRKDRVEMLLDELFFVTGQQRKFVVYEFDSLLKQTLIDFGFNQQDIPAFINQIKLQANEQFVYFKDGVFAMLHYQAIWFFLLSHLK